MDDLNIILVSFVFGHYYFKTFSWLYWSFLSVIKDNTSSLCDFSLHILHHWYTAEPCCSERHFSSKIKTCSKKAKKWCPLLRVVRYEACLQLRGWTVCLCLFVGAPEWHPGWCNDNNGFVTQKRGEKLVDRGFSSREQCLESCKVRKANGCAYEENGGGDVFTTLAILDV